MSKPIDIVLVSWYRPEMTYLVINTIHKNTKRENFRLIVIDNGSPQDQAVELLRMHNELGLIDELILNDTNRGLEPARNQGLALVESRYFICADNDCLPQPPVNGKDWVELLVELIDKHPDYAAISCRTQVMVGTGNIFEEADNNGEEIVEFPHPGGSLRIMETELTRTLGGWREEAEGRGAEERYICGKIRETGRRTGFATHIRTLHLFGDRTKHTDRWGYNKDWEPSKTGHSDIYHPALENGDDPEEIAKYTGENYA